MATPEETNEVRDEGAPFVAPEAEASGQAAPEEARRFAAGGGGRVPRLTIANAGGAIRVRGAEDQDGITVRAVKPDGGVVALDDVAEVRETPDGELTIKVRPFGDLQRQVRRMRDMFDAGLGTTFLGNFGEFVESVTIGSSGRGAVTVHFEATVPHRCDLNLTTASGKVEATGVVGELHLQTASGRLRGTRLGGKLVARTASGAMEIADVDGAVYLHSASGEIGTARIDGNLVIQTASGDVEGRYIAGQLGFKSASGDLDIGDSHLHGLYLNTASGDCTIDAYLRPGDYEARTVSGDIDLRVQPDFSATLTGRSLNGSFRSALPHQHTADEWRDDEADDGEDNEEEELAETPGGGEFAVPGIRIDDSGVSMPGIRIDGSGVSLPGIRIDGSGIAMPGIRLSGDPARDARAAAREVHRAARQAARGAMREARRAEREERRRRKRGRNRWSFLIGDPAAAAAGEIRLRIRTVSGDLSIGTGRSAYQPPRAPDAAIGGQNPTQTVEAHEAGARPGAWPDSELWPPTPPTPPAPPQPPVAAASPVSPVPPVPPVPPAPPAEQAAEDNPGERQDIERSRLEILQAVERKEITTEEALLLLRQLEE